MLASDNAADTIAAARSNGGNNPWARAFWIWGWCYDLEANATEEELVRAGRQLEAQAIAEREEFCDTLGRDDDMPRNKPFALSGAMRSQLVSDQ